VHRKTAQVLCWRVVLGYAGQICIDAAALESFEQVLVEIWMDFGEA
jgi:hypothetical protein